MKKISFQNLKRLLPGIQKNIPLKIYTTFKIGGPAQYFFIAKTKEDLIKAVLMARKFKLPFFILGGGSNLLVSDRGYKGLVIKVRNQKLKIKNNTIYSEAGVLLSQILGLSLKNNLTNLEWAAGIPGTIGGAIRGNAGSKKESIKDTVEIVEVFDIKNNKIKFLKNKNCKFAYRNSIFKKNKNLIILSVEIKLKKRKTSKIQKNIKKYLNHKRKTQPLNFPSAGSIFKNYESIIRNYKLLKKFPKIQEFNIKKIIPAWYLIEKCGLKGKKIGNIEISEKHANFILNLGNGKAGDVIKLINLIKKKVKKKFGIILKEEIQYLGF